MPLPKGGGLDAALGVGPVFQTVDAGRYRMTVPGGGELELDFLRRESGQLRGEILVKCHQRSARTLGGGVITVGDFNVSSTTMRARLAKDLSERAPGAQQSGEPPIDWRTAVETLCQRVLVTERAGQPAVLLHEVSPPRNDSLRIAGLRLYPTAPTIVFGDGGSFKSLLALYLAGMLAKSDWNIGYFDWELDAGNHRKRLESLFGADMPKVYYARCDQSLPREADRLRRIVRDNELEYLIFDSIAFACGGAPESAEEAVKYQGALRYLAGEVGSLHLAHISKGGEGNDQKPFGSVFWNNFGRDTWNVKIAEGMPGDTTRRIALHNRKANLDARAAPIGYEFQFIGERTVVRQVPVEDDPDLAASLSVQQRMYHLLRRGSLPIADIAEELEAKPDTVQKAVRRHPDKFVLREGRVHLLDTRRKE